jgi:hypothetical protein
MKRREQLSSFERQQKLKKADTITQKIPKPCNNNLAGSRGHDDALFSTKGRFPSLTVLDPTNGSPSDRRGTPAAGGSADVAVTLLLAYEQ